MGWDDVVLCGGMGGVGDDNVPWNCTHTRMWVVGRVGGGVGWLHIERKITSVVHSHPPSHYIRTHALG